MQLLTAKEIKQIRASKAFALLIEKTCNAYMKGLYDYLHGDGYKNAYANKSEETAYDLGWNKGVTVFPNSFPAS